MPTQLISKAADWNNSLTRKILGCKTPAEMFETEILKTAQGAERRAFAAARPLLLRLPLGEKKNIPMASVAFDIAIYKSWNIAFCALFYFTTLSISFSRC
ncbi:MAG: hypothetical protein LBU32_05790 [Clostridiales bacterium]|jgi:hypothetical protein|nr:hypothetical protein [Clostridiales bacterium]